MRHLRPLLFAATLLPVACSEDAGREATEPGDFPGWGSKRDEIGASLTTTRDPTAQIFDGYNGVVDAAIRRTCVVPEDGSVAFADFRVGGDLITTELQYITSRKQLEQTLDIDAQAKLKLGALGGGGQLGIHRSFKSSDRAVTILLRSRHVYTVINQQDHVLTDASLQTLRSDPARFHRECGTDYIAGVAHGAELVLLIQIESSSLEKKQELQTRLEASGIKAGPASIDATLGGKFASALGDESAHVTVSVDTRGFVPQVDLAALTRLDGDAFAVAAEANKQLRASVALDECHDQGDAGPGTCGGAKARGYLGNGARAAVPMGILRQQFQRTGNFPSEPAIVDAMVASARAADQANATLEQYAALYDAMVAIWADEVGALVESERPFDFGLYDTTATMRDDFLFDEFVTHASDWADVFDPSGGDAMRQLARAIEPCWTRAEFADFSDCLAQPAGTSDGAAVLATIAQYGAARVRPVFYASASAAKRHLDAAAACPKGWRLPNAYEANRLWFAIERNPDLPLPTATDGVLQGHRAAWYDDLGRDCASNEGSYLEQLADGSFHTGCYAEPGGFFSSAMTLPVVCLPKTGVYGTSVPKLP